MASLGLLVLYTENTDAVLKFYEAIGLAFVEEKHGSGPTHYACELGDTVIEIYPGSQGSLQNYKAGGATLLGLNVASLDATLDNLEQIGVVPDSPPKSYAWGRWCRVLDPDGRGVNLSEPKT
jgi:lactoylglutathione lyase